MNHLYGLHKVITADPVSQALLGAALTLIGLLPMARFVWFFLQGDGDGHIQSLVIGGALLTVGVLVTVLGILADLIATNRKLMETSILKLRRIEEQLDRVERAQGQSRQTRTETPVRRKAS